MQLKRRNSKAEANVGITFDEVSDYIRVVIDIYSATVIRRELWLTEREKEFFIATVIHVMKGHVNPISDPALQIYKKYFNPATNKVKIADYINRVRKKGWVLYNKRKKVVEIPPIFHKIGESGDQMTFNLTLKWEPSTD